MIQDALDNLKSFFHPINICWIQDEPFNQDDDILDYILNNLSQVCIIEEEAVDIQNDDMLDEIMSYFPPGICLIDIKYEYHTNNSLYPQDMFDNLYNLMCKGTCIIDDDQNTFLTMCSCNMQLSRHNDYDYQQLDILDYLTKLLGYTPYLIDDELDDYFQPLDMMDIWLQDYKHLGICFIEDDTDIHQLQLPPDILDIFYLNKSICLITDEYIETSSNSILIVSNQLDIFKKQFPISKFTNIQYTTHDNIYNLSLYKFRIVFSDQCNESALYLSQQLSKSQKCIVQLVFKNIMESVFFNIKWNNIDNVIITNKQYIYLDLLYQKLNKIKNKLTILDNTKKNPLNNLRECCNQIPKKSMEIIHQVQSLMTYIPDIIPLFETLQYTPSTQKYFDIGIIDYDPIEKKIDKYLSIFKLLVKKNKNYKLHLLYKDYNSSDYFSNTLSKYIYFYNRNQKKLFYKNIGILISTSFFEDSTNYLLEGIIAGTFPIILEWMNIDQKKIFPEVYSNKLEIVNRIQNIQKQNIPLDIYRQKYIKLYQENNPIKKYFTLFQNILYTPSNDSLKYMKISSPYNTKYNTNQYQTNIYPKSNCFEVDIRFYQEINRLNKLKLKQLYYHLKTKGIQLGLIYHPKQIENFLGFKPHLFIQNNQIYIQIYNNSPLLLYNWLHQFLYKIPFKEFINDIHQEFNQLSSSRLLILAYIGYKDVGIKLLKKIINYQNIQPFALAICFRNNSLLNFFKKKVKKNFKNVGIFVNKEYGNDIIPTLQMYNQIKHNKYSYIIKVQTKNDPQLFEAITNFLLEHSLKDLKRQLYPESNCVGLPGFTQYCQTGNLYPNQFLIQVYKKYLDEKKKYIITTNFFCKSPVFNKVLQFMEKHDYRSYFLNNMYDNNTINYFNSPPHFLERLFGMINI